MGGRVRHLVRVNWAWWLELGVHGKLVMGGLELFRSDGAFYYSDRGHRGESASTSDVPCLPRSFRVGVRPGVLCSRYFGS